MRVATNQVEDRLGTLRANDHLSFVPFQYLASHLGYYLLDVRGLRAGHNYHGLVYHPLMMDLLLALPFHHRIYRSVDHPPYLHLVSLQLTLHGQPFHQVEEVVVILELLKLFSFFLVEGSYLWSSLPAPPFSGLEALHPYQHLLF